MSGAWLCSGCGVPAPARYAGCDCPTSALYRRGQSGLDHSTKREVVDLTVCPRSDSACQSMQYQLRQFARGARLTNGQRKRLEEIAASADRAKAISEED